MVLKRLAAATWRELLAPLAVVVGLLAVAVALVEGPPVQAFLYAVF